MFTSIIILNLYNEKVIYLIVGVTAPFTLCTHTLPSACTAGVRMYEKSDGE